MNESVTQRARDAVKPALSVALATGLLSPSVTDHPRKSPIRIGQELSLEKPHAFVGLSAAELERLGMQGDPDRLELTFIGLRFLVVLGRKHVVAAATVSFDETSREIDADSAVVTRGAQAIAPSSSLDELELQFGDLSQPTFGSPPGFVRLGWLEVPALRVAAYALRLDDKALIWPLLPAPLLPAPPWLEPLTPQPLSEEDFARRMHFAIASRLPRPKSMVVPRDGDDDTFDDPADGTGKGRGRRVRRSG